MQLYDLAVEGDPVGGYTGFVPKQLAPVTRYARAVAALAVLPNPLPYLGPVLVVLCVPYSHDSLVL